MFVTIKDGTGKLLSVKIHLLLCSKCSSCWVISSDFFHGCNPTHDQNITIIQLNHAHSTVTCRTIGIGARDYRSIRKHKFWGFLRVSKETPHNPKSVSVIWVGAFYYYTSWDPPSMSQSTGECSPCATWNSHELLKIIRYVHSCNYMIPALIFGCKPS